MKVMSPSVVSPGQRTCLHVISTILAAIRNAGFELLRRPSYSPEVARIDFSLFPELEEFMKECKITDTKTAGRKSIINDSSTM